MGPANLTITPATHEFGPLAIASTSVPYTFTFTNTGGDPATGCSAPVKIGTNPGDFVIMTDTCAAMDLAGGASCTVQVAAKPTTTGLRTMTLSRTCTTGGTAATTADGVVVNRPMYIFATDAEYTGNLGGLSGADLKCNTLGNVGSASSGKAQNWKAVLSTMTGTVVNAKDRFVWTGPMYNMNNEMVVVDPSTWPWTPVNNLSSIRYDQNKVVPGSYAATGSTEFGLPTPADCNAWTDGTDNYVARTGEIGTISAANWINSFNSQCSSTYFALYCISQP